MEMSSLGDPQWPGHSVVGWLAGLPLTLLPVSQSSKKCSQYTELASRRPVGSREGFCIHKERS